MTFRRCARYPFAAAAGLAAAWIVWTLPVRGQPLLIDRQTVREPVSEGVELIRIRQFDAQGWLNLFVLEVDTARSHLSWDALVGNERLTEPEKLTSIARRRGAIGGVNGDFFHIRTTHAPLGAHVQSGELFKSPDPGRELAVGARTPDLTGLFIGPIRFSGTVSQPGGPSTALSGWNLPAVPKNGMVLYNDRWGSRAPGPDGPDMRGWSGLVHVLLDADQQVVEVRQEAPGPEIPAGGSVLLGRGNGADWLRKHARPGQPLEISHSLGPPEIWTAIGGGPLILSRGEVLPAPGGDVHPRTAVGFNREDARAWLLVVDGRSRLSRGVSLHDLALLLRELGAEEAINLDGGGSSTLVARTPGAAHPVVQNNPADGGERPVPNGLGLFTSAPRGSMTRLFFRPPAPPGAYPIETVEVRLAPGSLYRPVVVATDENGNPVEISAEDLAWKVEPSELGDLSSDGVFTARQEGEGRIQVRCTGGGKEAEAAQPIRVIGPVVRLEFDPPEIAVSQGQDVTLQVNAVDEKGYRAPLPLENVQWETRGRIGEVRKGKLLAAETPGSGAVSATFGEIQAWAPVGIGERPVLLAAFDDSTQWSTRTVPSEALSGVSAADHKPHIREREQAVRLEYDFTAGTRTRAAYLLPADGDLPLPGRPLRLGLWVYGDGREGWLRGQVVEAAGTVRPVDFAGQVDWTGWRHVEAEIPPETDYPISLRSIYVVETNPDAQYTGSLYFDELQAVHAPELDEDLIPSRPELPDPANRPEEIDPDQEGHFRFIVFGGSWPGAPEPASPGAEILTRLIGQINEEDAAFILFTGDLIENSEENDLVRRKMLDGLRLPYRLTVGGHDAAGSGNYDRYRQLFGPTYYEFTHGNSHFLVLNTARPGLRKSEAKQWPWLRDRLEMSDHANLFVLTHTPLIVPVTGREGGWTDAAEIGFFQKILSDERERRKNVYVFHGDVHGFDRRIHDRVQYLISGGPGTPIDLPPHKGGFVHYTVVTVRGDEVTYQVIPLLDEIELPEGIELKVGETRELGAVGVSATERVSFPLEHPAAVQWTAADRIIRLDPAAGTITAVEPGETILTVRSGGKTASTKVRVVER